MLEAFDMLKWLESLGSFQVNHVWMVTLKSLDAKRRLVSHQEQGEAFPDLGPQEK